MFEYLEQSSSIPYGAPNGGPPAPAPAAAVAADAGAPGPAAELVRPRSPKLLLSFGVAQVSLLWLVSGLAGRLQSAEGIAWQ